MAWIDGLNTDYIDISKNPYKWDDEYLYEGENIEGLGVTYATVKIVRSGYLGIVPLSGQATGAKVYVWLYKFVDKYLVPAQTMSGYFYRISHTQKQHKKWKRYNSGPHGIKAYADFNKPAAAPSSSSTSGSVSSSTNNTFGPVTAGTRDRSAWLEAIAGRPWFGDFTSQSFRQNAENALIAKGYTLTEARAYLKARDDVERGYIKKYAEDRINAALNKLFGGSSSGGSNSGSSSSSNNSNPAANYAPISFPQVQTRLTVRMPTGFLVPDQAALKSIKAPALNQTFLDEDGKVQSYTYQFDHVPQNIQYSGLGSEWVEIPRAENYAFVDWSRYQLMRVSMSWIISTNRVETGGAVVHDGLFNSIDSLVTDLRRMAQRKYPVTIVNMDDLLSVQLKVDSKDGQVRSVSGMQFVISDLSITASRRTSDPDSGQPTSPSKIAVAQCQMTLQECPIESVQIISFPKLDIPFTPPPAKPGTSSTPMGPNYILASTFGNPPADRSNLTTPAPET